MGASAEELELSAVLNLIPYLDSEFTNYVSGKTTISDILATYDIAKADEDHIRTYQTLKAAIDSNPSYGDIVLVNQSSPADYSRIYPDNKIPDNNSEIWTDDLIQACTFRDPATGDYYVTFRGTGAGRWVDNGDGMTTPSTEMQRAAAAYFDSMAENGLVDAYINGANIYVTGHSKGGNEAQYVFMSAEYEHIISRCYSLDGQGFSRAAIEVFKERYGEDYANKLANMYSLCGENDYVHDLGYVIIPEENTFYVHTSDDPNPLRAYHGLEYMIATITYADGEIIAEYTGLSWGAEKGEAGRYAQVLSEAMMQLDDEDLHGAALALMALIDMAMSSDSSLGTLGPVQVDWTDYVDLAAHGLPAIIKTLFLTEEGRAILDQLISAGIQKLYDKWGAGGVVGGFWLGSLVLKYIVAPLVVDIIVIANVLDFFIDTVNKIVTFAKKAYDVLVQMKDFVVTALKKGVSFLKSLTAGGRYAAANPQITVNTYKLRNYAQRLQAVNRRISNLDRRLDSLYWQVGLLDLWRLMQADLLTGYSWRLLRCSGYLNDTATDFENVESALQNNL